MVYTVDFVLHQITPAKIIENLDLDGAEGTIFLGKWLSSKVDKNEKRYWKNITFSHNFFLWSFSFLNLAFLDWILDSISICNLIYEAFVVSFFPVTWFIGCHLDTDDAPLQLLQNGVLLEAFQTRDRDIVTAIIKYSSSTWLS